MLKVPRVKARERERMMAKAKVAKTVRKNLLLKGKMVRIGEEREANPRAESNLRRKVVTRKMNRGLGRPLEENLRLMIRSQVKAETKEAKGKLRRRKRILEENQKEVMTQRKVGIREIKA